MATMVCLLAVMMVITIGALCAAGVHQGEDRMLNRLRSTLVEARVIEASRPTTSDRRTQRRQAAALNQAAFRSEHQLQAIGEVPDQEAQRPTVPTRTYSIRYLHQRPSLANMKRRVSAAFATGSNLIDLNEVPPQNPPLRPEEEGNWV